MKHVVIVGGGFAGINAAKELGRRAATDEVRVTVVDKRNHHLFQPLLYQVAMAGLSPADIATPIRSILRSYPCVEVQLAEVSAIDTDEKRLTTTAGELQYDYLLLSCGAQHSYFGNDHWEDHAPGLKTLEHATEIRRRVLTAFEQAELENDPDKRKEWLTFVVVGAGPTGVELAGALGEISRYTLARDFRNIDPSRTRVLLIEGGSRVLPTFEESSSRAAAASLEKLGVTIWTSSQVTDVTADGVALGVESVRARTVLWAAGVRASELNSELPGSTDRSGRIDVRSDLSLERAPEVFVVGDQARFTSEGNVPLPGMAPVAIQQGRHAARNILRDLRSQSREPFQFVDKGQMATIGRAAAVAETKRLRLRGFIAWLAWGFIHVLYLVSFRNRMLVLVQWTWSYFRFRRGARLITSRWWRREPAAPPEYAESASGPDER
ncbi:MAG: NAD(P)/FAD-dependent oxidoreductase [Planctomycetota bacterium]